MGVLKIGPIFAWCGCFLGVLSHIFVWAGYLCFVVKKGVNKVLRFCAKTLVLWVLLQALILAGVTWIGTHFEANETMKSFDRDSQERLAMLQAASQALVLESKLTHVDAFLREVVRVPSIAYVRINDAVGATMLEQGSEPYLTRAFLPDRSPSVVNDGVYDRMVEIKAATGHAEVLGFVQLGMLMPDQRPSPVTMSVMVFVVAFILGGMMAGLLVVLLGPQKNKDSEQEDDGVEIKARAEILTEESKSDDRKEEAARRCGFLSVMNHEIRTPMNGLLGNLALLEDSGLQDQQARLLKNARLSSQRLWSVVNDVLDIARLEQGDLVLKEGYFSPSQLVEQAVELLAEDARGKGIEVASYVDPNVPEQVLGDGDRVKQVLVELMNNAVRFTRFGGVKLTLSMVGTDISTATSKDTLQFEVSDTGVGVSASESQELFCDLASLDESGSKGGGGKFGLSLSRHLVALMGGHLDFASDVGKGSRFSFRLPMVKMVSETRAESSSTESLQQRSRIKGLRFLLVDDNHISRSVYKDQLDAWGAEVDAVEKGSHVVDMLRAAIDVGRPYDLAIIDLDMPEMNGIKLLEHIRSVDDFSNMAIVSMVTHSAFGSSLGLKEKGFDAFLVKPIRQDSLAYWLANALEHENLLDQAVDKPTENVEADEQETPYSPVQQRVLLVEDSPANQLVASAMLTKAGYLVEVVDNGALAVEAVENQDWDLILMDIQMPVMDGLEATRLIRKMAGPAGTVPIVAVTANVFPEDRQACVAVGMAEVVAKPIRRDNLLAAVERWIRHPESMLEDAVLDLHLLGAMRAKLGEKELVAVLNVFIREVELRISRLAEESSWPVELNLLKKSGEGFGASGLVEACVRHEGAFDRDGLQDIAETFEKTKVALARRYAGVGESS